MKFGTLPLCAVTLMLCTVLLSFSCNRPNNADESGKPSSAMPITQCNIPASKIKLTGKFCGSAPDLQMSCYLPNDIDITTTDYNQNQRQADIFSWQEFISLNWPAVSGRRGVPDASQNISAPGARVWETWKEEYEVFLPNGAVPPVWDAPEPIPVSCTNATKRLLRTQKINDVIDEMVQAAGATAKYPATLTDQAAHLARYEIRMNKVMFDYIMQNKLYDANVQKNFGPIDFPDGGILVKASWIEVTTLQSSQYHTVTACVCDRDQNGQPVNCQTKQMGLVGLHITQKSANAPQWIWSTFEQKNNVPVQGVSGHPAFYNPQCSTCPTNQQTQAGTPNQITRVKDIPSVNPNCSQPLAAVDNVDWLNQDVATAMKAANSVFQYYELVNTQWPLPPVDKNTTTVFKAQPAVLGNTTMETFVQETSSCMGCHAMARTVNPLPTSFVSSDFTFTLNNAKPNLPNPNVIPTPGPSPVTQWDKDNWASIKRGYLLATQTYEQLPKNVPASKLHCASCHLNAGGNMTAAWWVNLKQEYPTLPDLQNRINGCFQNSMNGYALCTPQGKSTPFNAPACKPGDDMSAFTAYMDWLTEQWNNPSTNTHGFPPLANPTPSPLPTPNLANGQSVFQQKCAVCHRLDGQGRYEDNLYFRPALWGKHSFNKSAGMFSDPMMLTTFIRWNMPLGSGGLLTNLEAIDVAGYVDAQARPTPIPTPPTKR